MRALLLTMLAFVLLGCADDDSKTIIQQRNVFCIDSETIDGMQWRQNETGGVYRLYDQPPCKKPSGNK